MAGLRNVVVHEYFRVRADLVCAILDTSLAELAAAISGDQGSGEA